MRDRRHLRALRQRDEAAMTARAIALHRRVQAEGRGAVFADYRLRDHGLSDRAQASANTDILHGAQP